MSTESEITNESYTDSSRDKLYLDTPFEPHQKYYIVFDVLTGEYYGGAWEVGGAVKT